jgi:hypothetical protein
MVQFALAKGDQFAPFYFNLSGPVGRGYRNARPDDVALVQMCFALGAVRKEPPPPEIKTVWDKVKVTGRTDDATLAGIDAWQGYRRKRFGGAFEADGIISVVRTPNALYAPGTPYDILQMNLILATARPSIWPRLDKDPLCTPELGASIRASLGPFVSA